MLLLRPCEAQFGPSQFQGETGRQRWEPTAVLSGTIYFCISRGHMEALTQ